MQEHAPVRWYCNAAPCSNSAPFDRQDEFEDHMRRNHPDMYTDAQLSRLARTSGTTELFQNRKCPICDDYSPFVGLNSADIPGDLQKHIAAHLESLAQLCLPSSEDVENEVPSTDKVMTEDRETGRNDRLERLSLTFEDPPQAAVTGDEGLSRERQGMIEPEPTEEYEPWDLYYNPEGERSLSYPPYAGHESDINLRSFYARLDRYLWNPPL